MIKYDKIRDRRRVLYVIYAKQYALAETLKKKFSRRNMDAFYCATKEEAKNLILSMIPEGSSVTWGGTESMEEAGVCEAVRRGNYEFIDRKSAKTPEEARALYGKVVCADYFLTSTNAFTTDGELVNIDGASNRVALHCPRSGSCHYPCQHGQNVRFCRRRLQPRTHTCQPSKRHACRCRCSLCKNRCLRQLFKP